MRDPGPARVCAELQGGKSGSPCRSPSTATVNSSEPGAAGSGQESDCCNSSVDRHDWGSRSVFVEPGVAAGRVSPAVFVWVS